ncbi:MAG: helix-turn-helix transcriptional regulator [Cyanothece sp. SIO1E1]|nr:helix-turn-helix transcriptional regulator [Cyanothece sp. SIO1E1]
MEDCPAFQLGLSTYQLDCALAYIDTHLDQDIKLQGIADEFGMSLYCFYQRFEQSMGVNPYQYLLQQRIECARQLLHQQEFSLTDVALQCGFDNQSQLTYHFSQQLGMTPRLYREE